MNSKAKFWKQRWWWRQFYKPEPKWYHYQLFSSAVTLKWDLKPKRDGMNRKFPSWTPAFGSPPLLKINEHKTLPWFPLELHSFSAQELLVPIPHVKWEKDTDIGHRTLHYTYSLNDSGVPCLKMHCWNLFTSERTLHKLAKASIHPRHVLIMSWSVPHQCGS